MFSYPLFVCDLGGTNCRMALSPKPDADIEMLGSVKTSGFSAFAGAVHSFIKQAVVKPASLIVCAAGPLRGRQVQLTNADWLLDGSALAKELGLQQGLLLNDFEALALSLPIMRDDWMRPIASGEPDKRRPQVVLGPGTGLGMASLVEWDGRYLALASEAGHMDFAPSNRSEEAIWSHLRSRLQRITPETLLSGPGLARLHDARLQAENQPENKVSSFDAAGTGDKSAQIIAAALAAPQSEEATSVRLFWNLVARFAGDVALALFARGGVTLAGGILPRMVELLDAAAFKATFAAKQPMQDLVATMPVRLLMHSDAVLHGMAAIAANPDRYMLDYASRNWR